jgi:hypothetical protein
LEKPKGSVINAPARIVRSVWWLADQYRFCQHFAASHRRSLADNALDACLRFFGETTSDDLAKEE